MASASKRLNERLAKYNHLYDDDELNSSSADGSISSDMADNPIASVTINGTADTNGEENSNENNNIIVPETLPVKKIMESVSVHVNGGGEQQVSAANVTEVTSCSVVLNNAGMRLSSPANYNGADAAAVAPAANGGVQVISTNSSSTTADQTNNQHVSLVLIRWLVANNVYGMSCIEFFFTYCRQAASQKPAVPELAIMVCAKKVAQMK